MAREARAASPWRLASRRSPAASSSGGLRTARVAAPVLDISAIVDITGFVEEVDLRRSGARFVLRVASAEGLDPAATPRACQAHDAARRRRLRPAISSRSRRGCCRPPMPRLPGGYDFARDAYFARLGAVGNALGRIETDAAARSAGSRPRAMSAAVDRGRNALARRVDRIVGGDTGAIAAAMVTGKRDFLDDDAKDIIREAGIFHIITISGVQMTLVAGIFFVGLAPPARLSSRTLALNYPIKKWAAGARDAGRRRSTISRRARASAPNARCS